MGGRETIERTNAGYWILFIYDILLLLSPTVALPGPPLISKLNSMQSGDSFDRGRIDRRKRRGGGEGGREREECYWLDRVRFQSREKSEHAAGGRRKNYAGTKK